MNDETQVAEELSAFAPARAGQIARRRRGEHWKEDAIQTLSLAGWEFSRATRDIEPAKHRMAGRPEDGGLRRAAVLPGQGAGVALCWPRGARRGRVWRPSRGRGAVGQGQEKRAGEFPGIADRRAFV